LFTTSIDLESLNCQTPAIELKQLATQDNVQSEHIHQLRLTIRSLDAQNDPD